MTGETILKIDSLGVRRDGRDVLRGVGIDVRRGERLVLMGLSGGGKTTILRTVVALEQFDAGTIDVDGFRLISGPIPAESKLRPLRERAGMVFQMHHLFDHMSAVDNVALAPIHVRRRDLLRAREHARDLLESFGVGHRADALPRELSGGEAQRVAIARALAIDPPLLLMDEPTASLDPARRGDLAALLRRLADDGRTLLVATHDVEFARQLATRVVVLAAGAIVEEGTPEEIFSAPRHPETKRLLRGDDA